MGDIVIAPLFVARLGLIGYAYTSNDFITIYALLIDVFILVLLLFVYLKVAENLRDICRVYSFMFCFFSICIICD